MDPRTDGDRFNKGIERLYAALKGGAKAPDALRDAMWKALSDVSITEVLANIDRIIATAKPETPFPRPSALRNNPASISSAPSDTAIRAERMTARNWEDLRRRDPVAHQIEWRLAIAARRLIDPEDEEHCEWVAEYRRWSSLRYAPRAEQEAAVRKVLGHTEPNEQHPTSVPQ